VNGSLALVPGGVDVDGIALLHGSAALGEGGLGEGVSGLPLGRCTRRSLSHHLVDLLERQTLGLGNKEVGVDESSRAQSTPDEENGGAEVALINTDHVRGDDSDDGVPEPVGGGGESNTTGTDGKREDLANKNPSTRTPGGGEEEDEDGDEGNLSVDGRDVVGLGSAVSEGGRVVESLGDTNDGGQELANQHAESTVQQKCAATELLHSVEREGSRADVDEGEDQGDQEGVRDGAGRLEERCGVVEDEVDTSPLLHHLKGGTENGLAEVGVGLEERTLEAVGPASEPATSGGELTLVLLVGDDLSKLVLNHGPVLGSIVTGRVNATNLHQSGAGLLGLAALDEVARGVGQAGNTTTKNQAPSELDTNGNAVLASVAAVLDSVVDAGGEKETDGDAELVTRHKRTTDLLGANLGHVENDNGRLETDTNTGDDTTSDKEVATASSNLENHTCDDISYQIL
jgi:hypothetical protein